MLCGGGLTTRVSLPPAKAVDRYIELRTAEDSGTSIEKLDPRLQDIIESIFTRCIDDGEYKQVGAQPHAYLDLATHA